LLVTTGDEAALAEALQWSSLAPVCGRRLSEAALATAQILPTWR
jgi:hypothetical protein